jgi:hypothetical protein
MACSFKLFSGNPKGIPLMLTNVSPIHVHINLGLQFFLNSKSKFCSLVMYGDYRADLCPLCGSRSKFAIIENLRAPVDAF